MMILNGAINTLDLVNTKQFNNPEGTKGIKGSNGKDFMEIFQSKLQLKENNQQKSLPSKSGNIQTANHNALNTTNNAVEKQNKPLVYNEASVEETKESSSGDEGKGNIPAQKEDTSKDSPKLEIEEEVFQQYEGVIPPQLLQQLEEVLTTLQQQGYMTEEKVEAIMVQLEEVSNPQEMIAKLDNLLEEFTIKAESSNIEAITQDKIDVLEKAIKSILDDLGNQSFGEFEGEGAKIQGALYHNQAPVEKNTEASIVVEDDKSLEKVTVEKATDFQSAEKAVKTNDYENVDIEESHILVDLSKNFEVKLNNIGNQTLNPDEIHAKNLMEQLIHKVEGTYKAGKTQLKLQLMPENLGKLSIDLSTDNQTIRAKVFVESLQVKEIIESSLNQFKESLREKGLNISSVEVSVGQDSEAFLQNRSFAQQRLKIKKSPSAVSDGLVGIQEANSIIDNNPYLVNEGFDKLG